MKTKKLLLWETVLYGTLGAVMFALQAAMSGLPNIEPVSLLIMVYAAVFGKRCLFCVYVYVVLDILLFGIGVWNICYLYVWAILAAAALLMRKTNSSVLWAALSGAFGLLFGALCGIVDVFIGGLSYAAARWVSGIPFDLAHCAGNFILALLLFAPLKRAIEKLYGKIKRDNG